MTKSKESWATEPGRWTTCERRPSLPCARLVKDRKDLVSIDQRGLDAQGLVDPACVGRLVSADVAELGSCKQGQAKIIC